MNELFELAKSKAGVTSEQAFERLIDGMVKMPKFIASIWEVVGEIASNKDSKFYHPQLAEYADCVVEVYGD